MTLGGKEEASAGRVREPTGSISLVRLLLAFLKIGSIGFGGGMAVIALMQQEFVRKRRLIPLDEFVHGVGMGQVLGAFAVNVAIFIGYRLFGVAGALLSAGAFLAPSITLVIIFSDLYFRYHAVPALQGAVAGLAPVVIALILDAGWSIGRKVLRSWPATVLVEDQRVGERADFQQTMPVGVVPGQARDFEPHDHARVSHADIGDQALKTFPPGCRCARLALIVVDDDNLIVAPAQCCGAMA
jgi:chromate transporter